MLQTVVLIFHPNAQLRQDRRNLGFVFGVKPASEDLQSDRAVDRAGIDIDNIQFPCKRLGKRAFSRAGGTVNCNGIMLFRHDVSPCFSVK